MERKNFSHTEQNLENQKLKFEVAFEKINPHEPTPIEIFSAQNTLNRLKNNLASLEEVPENLKNLLSTLSELDVLNAMQILQRRGTGKGYTIPMLYSEEINFISEFQEQSEVANANAQDPFEYFSNKDELVAWLLIFTKSFQHSDQRLDESQKEHSTEIKTKYAEFLSNLKSRTDSSYAKVIQFSEENTEENLTPTVDKQLQKHIKTLIGDKEHITVVREAGIYEPIQPFLDRYDASSIILVDPRFSDKEYQDKVEKYTKEIDPNYSKETEACDYIFKFTYKNKKREVVLKSIMLDTDSIKKIQTPDVYEMGGASVEGTQNIDYLSSLYDHMGKRGIIIDLHRHAADKAYREFVKQTPNIGLIAFSFPFDKNHLYGGHEGIEPGYRVMLSFQK